MLPEPSLVFPLNCICYAYYFYGSNTINEILCKSFALNTHIRLHAIYEYITFLQCHGFKSPKRYIVLTISCGSSALLRRHP